ncbi:hypothetical protein [Rosistilla oblonga]|nr:hypothetical protein [Rosistilla oblonga]
MNDTAGWIDLVPRDLQGGLASGNRFTEKPDNPRSGSIMTNDR